MAPIIPLLLISFIIIFPLIGGLIYLGIRGINSKPINKFFGILSIIASIILIGMIGLLGYTLLNNKDKEREKFIGIYKSVNNNSGQIELTITSSSFSITPNTLTACRTGAWEIELMDEGYIIDFNCSIANNSSQFYLKGDELITLNGELKFVKQKENK